MPLESHSPNADPGLGTWIAHHLEEASEVLRRFASEERTIFQCAMMAANVLADGGQVLICGNGGSAAQAQHLATELVVRLRSSVQRAAMRAVALTTDTSMLTAGANDYGFESVFSRQVEGLGRPGDLLIGISTSGRSQNVLNAFATARERGLHTVLWTGDGGRQPAEPVDVVVAVPSEDTMRIQEGHLLLLHIFCDLVERMSFPELFGMERDPSG